MRRRVDARHAAGDDQPGRYAARLLLGRTCAGGGASRAAEEGRAARFHTVLHTGILPNKNALKNGTIFDRCANAGELTLPASPAPMPYRAPGAWPRDEDPGSLVLETFWTDRTRRRPGRLGRIAGSTLIGGVVGLRDARHAVLQPQCAVRPPGREVRVVLRCPHGATSGTSVGLGGCHQLPQLGLSFSAF